MRIVGNAWHEPNLPSGTVATIGNFDGVHRGQQAILAHVTRTARTKGLEPVVVTFEPHPLEVLRPEQAPPRLTTLEQKAALLRELGIETVLVVTFDEAFSRTSAREFVEDLLFRRLDARSIFIGSRFVFGRDREGSLTLLEELAAATGRSVTGIEEILDSNEPISSTRIRAAVSRGDVEDARRLLGRPYSVSGRVVHGDALGRRLGWPTLNLATENELLPAYGVYRSTVAIERERPRAAVTNVGVRPTMHVGGGPTLESYILDFERDLYGCEVEVALLDRLRGERRFSSPEELKEQIFRDVAETRRRFAATVGARGPGVR